jgi:hypothetical protein
VRDLKEGDQLVKAGAMYSIVSCNGTVYEPVAFGDVHEWASWWVRQHRAGWVDLPKQHLEFLTGFLEEIGGK